MKLPDKPLYRPCPRCGAKPRERCRDIRTATRDGVVIYSKTFHRERRIKE